MTKVEDVSWAICSTAGECSELCPACQDRARKAIEAMREPSPRMRHAGDEAMRVFSKSHEVFNRMCSAALTEGEQS